MKMMLRTKKYNAGARQYIEGSKGRFPQFQAPASE